MRQHRVLIAGSGDRGFCSLTDFALAPRFMNFSRQFFPCISKTQGDKLIKIKALPKKKAEEPMYVLICLPFLGPYYGSVERRIRKPGDLDMLI